MTDTPTAEHVYVHDNGWPGAYALELDKEGYAYRSAQYIITNDRVSVEPREEKLTEEITGLEHEAARISDRLREKHNYLAAIQAVKRLIEADEKRKEEIEKANARRQRVIQVSNAFFDHYGDSNVLRACPDWDDVAEAFVKWEEAQQK